MNPAWKPPPPCKVGDNLVDISTPALMVDLDQVEMNLKVMSRMMDSFPGVNLRPHIKAHKCPALAAMQIEHGAVGVCSQTLVESEAMVYGAAIKDVFLTNQLIGKRKLHRLAALAKHANISLCVDDLNNIQDISQVAQETGVKIGLVVEVNVGQDRAGVETGEPAAKLAQSIQTFPNVYFKGIQCYQGWNQHVRNADDRAKTVEIVVDKVKQTLKCLDDLDIKCDYVTGGGTGTFSYEAGSQVFTEVQPGSYVLMDVDYAKNLEEHGKYVNDFQHSLQILTTVTSVTAGDRAVVNAGMKAASLDSGVPTVIDRPDMTYHYGGDEHGILRPSADLKVGDLLRLIPGHCDPTVNLYDWLVGVRANKVETVWPILGRGPGA